MPVRRAGARAAFPDRPITLIVPWAAGGGTDAVARQIAMMLERDLKQPVNVVNRIGGSGVVGHSAIAGAAPDGYTIGMITLEINMMHWVGLTTLTSDQFTQFALMNTDAAAIHVKSNSPFKTVKELFAHIKANPNKVVASGSGQGGSWHLALAGLMQADGISPQSIRWVPATGAATALTDLAAGGVEFVSCSMPEAEALIKAGPRAQPHGDVGQARRELSGRADGRRGDRAQVAQGRVARDGRPEGHGRRRSPAQYETLLKKIHDSSEFQEFMAKRGFDVAWMGSTEFTAIPEEGRRGDRRDPEIARAGEVAAFATPTGSDGSHGSAARSTSPLVGRSARTARREGALHGLRSLRKHPLQLASLASSPTRGRGSLWLRLCKIDEVRARGHSALLLRRGRGCRVRRLHFAAAALAARLRHLRAHIDRVADAHQDLEAVAGFPGSHRSTTTRITTKNAVISVKYSICTREMSIARCPSTSLTTRSDQRGLRGVGRTAPASRALRSCRAARRRPSRRPKCRAAPACRW